MSQDHLPDIVQEFAKRFPLVWDSYNQLGKAAAEAGPLDEKTERLVKLALATGGGLEGAVRSHTRRAVAAGASPEEILHVALLGIATIGWPASLAAFKWMVDELQKPQA